MSISDDTQVEFMRATTDFMTNQNTMTVQTNKTVGAIIDTITEILEELGTDDLMAGWAARLMMAYDKDEL
jgi:hypothetical protein